MDKQNTNDSHSEAAKLLLELAEHIKDFERTEKNADTAVHVADGLLKAYTSQIAVNFALRRMLYQCIAQTSGRDIANIEREYLSIESEEYERVILNFSDDYPAVAEFLDTRPKQAGSAET